MQFLKNDGNYVLRYGVKESNNPNWERGSYVVTGTHIAIMR